MSHEELETMIKLATKSFKLMNLPITVVEYVLNSHGLEFYFNFYSENNQSSFLPFHNEHNAYYAVLNCKEAAIYYNLGESDTRSLLVAALFQNFNHSGGSLPESKNISNALAGLDSAMAFVANEVKFFPLTGDKYALLTREEYVNATNIIKSTKYPYDSPPTTLLEQIIRDADVMDVYIDEHIQALRHFCGLIEEIETCQSPDAVEELKKFDVRVVWNTKWAKEKAVTLRYKHLVKSLLEQ